MIWSPYNERAEAEQAASTSRYVVCPACEGEGYVSKVGAFTSSELDEMFGGDYDERDDFHREYARRGGAYDEPCPCCKGQRVATKEQVERWEFSQEMDAQYRAESAAYAAGL